MNIIKKTTTYRFSLLILQLAVMCMSFGPLIAKYASQYSINEYKFIVSYLILITLLIGYYVVWQYVLRKLPLSIAYSNRSSSIIWSLTWAFLITGESITKYNIIGSILIIIGIQIVTNE